MVDTNNKSIEKIVPIGQACENDTAFPITIAKRAYFSSYYLWTAKHFCEQIKLIEDNHNGPSAFDIKHRALVINSILSTVAFAEAAINEVFQDAADGHHSYINTLSKNKINLLSDYWYQTEKIKSYTCMLDKYQSALQLCDINLFNKGLNPFQDAQLVIILRNILMHYKPSTNSVNDEHTLSKQLKGKFQDNILMTEPGDPYFPNKCLGYGCAKWSLSSIEKLVGSFFEKIGITPNYKRINF